MEKNFGVEGPTWGQPLGLRPLGGWSVLDPRSGYETGKDPHTPNFIQIGRLEPMKSSKIQNSHGEMVFVVSEASSCPIWTKFGVYGFFPIS